MIKDKILNTGVEMWLENPASVTASGIARRLGKTHAAILYHFPYGVKEAVAEYAVQQKQAKIIAQLITTGHKSVRDLCPTDRARYLATF